MGSKGKRRFKMPAGPTGKPQGQAAQMQSQMEQVQAQLAAALVTGTSGGGAVTVEMTGDQQVKSIKIKPEVVDPEDVEMLEDLVLTAVTEAITKSQEAASSKLGGLTGGFKIPGLM